MPIKFKRLIIFAAALFITSLPATGGQYLVVGSDGPGFSSPQEMLEVLEKGVLPTFDALRRLETEKKIVAGGLPVGDRAFVFVLEAATNDEADRIVRDIPGWGVFNWQITPLQSFSGRAAKERSVVEDLKKRR